jgi:hypothetical protein
VVHAEILLTAAFYDLLGAVLATVGALLLAIPPFRDNTDRRIKDGIETWARQLTPGDPGEMAIRSSTENALERVRDHRKKDLFLMRWGVALLVLGLGLSIPAKINQLVDELEHRPVSHVQQ